jgi:HlyD family secretion protein
MNLSKKKKKIATIIVLTLIIIIVIKAFIFPSKFIYSGTLEADKIDLSARVVSIIQSYSTSEGSKAKAGDTLATLACEDIKISSEQSIRDFERAEKLFKENSLPKETYEHSKSKYDEAKTRLDWCVIKAPVDGTVLTTYMQEGELVSIGSKIVTIADLNNLWTYLYVAQPDVIFFKLGSEIKVYSPDADKYFKAKIIKINEEAEFTPKNVQTREERARLVFGIKIKIETGLDVLKPGMTVEVVLP